MRESREPSPSEGYQRPQQTWQCGLLDEGPACPLGPSGQGVCPASAACHPIRSGDRYQCNRSALRGGPCASGPSHEGVCSIVYHCTPVRSLRTRRGQFVVGVALAGLGAAIMVLSGSWRNELLAPGPLSAHHAQLLTGNESSPRCSQCHAASDMTTAQWWQASTGSASSHATQSTLCLACHRASIDPGSALAAHGVPLEALARADESQPRTPWHERQRNPRESIACAACHREHQGRDHNLMAMSDAACQACHREQFTSFSAGHPDFRGWPYLRRTRIAFDHAAHQSKHYPTEKRAFECATCHHPAADDERMLTVGYDLACASCHENSIVQSMAEGAPMLALPTLDLEAMARRGHSVETWPEEAAGDFEGSLPLPAAILILADQGVPEAANALGPQLDFYEVNPDDVKQTAAAAVVAKALKQLSDDLADRGQAAIGDRLRLVLGRELKVDELAALARGLSPDVAGAYRHRWFSGGSSDYDAQDRATLLERVSAGGWIRDDLTLSLRYRPMGHADPWMGAWLDVAAEAAGGVHREIAEPLLRAAIKPTAPGQCGSCHTLERDASGKLAVQWRAKNLESRREGFTRFGHGPHLIHPQTRDCASCHVFSKAPQTPSASSGDDPAAFVGGFEPITKGSCAECHVAGAAGDSCVQCHTYHGHAPQSALPAN